MSDFQFLMLVIAALAATFYGLCLGLWAIAAVGVALLALTHRLASRREAARAR